MDTKARTALVRQVAFFSALIGSLMRHPLGFSKALDAAVLSLPPLHPGAIHALSDWVRLCEATEIPCVPISAVGPAIPLADLEAFSEKPEEPMPSVAAAMKWVDECNARGEMWRFEQCATEMTKSVMGLIRPDNYLTVTRVNVPFGVDERVFHILWDSRVDSTRTVSRPWVNPLFDKGFPVEVRVYVPEGASKASEMAACSYYPQRALDAKFSPVIEEACRLTEALIARRRALASPEGVPMLPTSFSCDWILRADGVLFFLEGSPPFTKKGGAHPCCFAMDGVLPGRRLLKSEPGAMLYVPDAEQAVLDRVKDGSLDFRAAVTQLGWQPDRVAAYLAVQGYVPKAEQQA
jgi:hypothetical protein